MWPIHGYSLIQLTLALKHFGDPDSVDDEQIPTEMGTLILELEEARASQEWVRRRIETFGFEDERLITRYVELHIDLADWRDRLVATSRPSARSVPIPLQTFSLEAEVPHTLVDGAGTAVGFYDAERERNFVVAGICGRINNLFSDCGAMPPDLATLRGFVDAALQEARTAASHTKRRPFFRSPRLGTEDVWPSETPTILAELPNESRKQALRLIRRWSAKYVLLAMIPISRLDESILVRFEFEEKGGTRRGSRISALSHYMRHVGAGTLSWSARHRLDNAYRAANFHVRAVAPSGFKLIDPGIFLECRQDIARHGYWKFGQSGRPTTDISFKPDGNVAVEPAFFSTSLYANRMGFVSEALAVSVIVAGLLLAFSLRLSHVGFEVDSSRFDSPFSSAILLFVPFLLSAIALYKEGNRIASRAFGYTRFFLFLQFTAIIGAALPFALKLSPSSTEVVWYLAASVAWLACLRVAASTLLHFWRVSSTKDWRRWRRRRWEDEETPGLWADAIEGLVSATVEAQNEAERRLKAYSEAESVSDATRRQVIAALEGIPRTPRRVLISVLREAERGRIDARKKWNRAEKARIRVAEALQAEQSAFDSAHNLKVEIDLESLRRPALAEEDAA